MAIVPYLNPDTARGGHRAADFGAVGDGVADDAPAIQAALNACRPGEAALLDARPYRCASPLVGPDQVGLEARWGGLVSASVQERVSLAQRRAFGTVLINDWAATAPGDSTPAFLTIGADGWLRGLNLFDARQGTTAGAFVSRPWFLSLTQPDPNFYAEAYTATIEKVGMVNPYRGIRLQGMGRVTVRDVIMSPLVSGIWMDQQGDTSVLDNIHIIPTGWFADDSSYPGGIQNYIQSNLVAYRFGRVDSVLMSNCMVFSCQTGVKLEQSGIATTPREPWLRMTNIDIDVCDIGIDAQSTAAQGCYYSGGSITAASGGPNQIGIRAGAGCGILGISNVAIESFSAAEVRMAGGDLSFTGCTFNSFTQHPTGTSPSILATGGNLAVAGCIFQDARPPISWQYNGGIARRAGNVNIGGVADIDPNSRINAGGNS